MSSSLLVPAAVAWPMDNFVARKKMAASKQTHSGLLSLPPELRNRIYTEVFASNNNEGRTPFKKFRNASKSSSFGPLQGGWQTVDERKEASVLAFLQTCRQVLNEAEAIFFAINHIQMVYGDFRTFMVPFRHYGSSVRAKAIENLTVVKVTPNELGEVIGLAYMLPGLRRLHVDMVALHQPNGSRAPHERYFNREFITGNCGHLAELKVKLVVENKDVPPEVHEYALEQVEILNKALHSLIKKDTLEQGEAREREFSMETGISRRSKPESDYVNCDLYDDQFWIEK